MSIIHDALKKAQEQRKDKPNGVPFGNVPEPKKKPPHIVIGVVALAVVVVIAYLYIPAFHPKKATMPAQAMNVKPAQAAPATQAPPAVVAVPAVSVPPKTPESQAPPAKPIAPAIQMAANAHVLAAAKDAPRAVNTIAASGPYAADTAVRLTPVPKRSKGVQPSTDDELIRRIPARKAEDDSINRQYNDALTLMNSGQLKEAQKVFLALLARKPDHAEALNNMGVISATLGNRKDAVTYFKKLFEYRPNYAKAYNNIGPLLITEDPGLSEEYFRKAIALEPESLEPYLNLAALFRAGKKYAEAAKVLETPINKNVSDLNLYLAYAVVKDNLGHTSEAIKYYRQYVSLAKSSRERNGVVERLRYLEERGKR